MSSLSQVETAGARLGTSMAMIQVFRGFVTSLFSKLNVPVKDFDLGNLNKLLNEFEREVEQSDRWRSWEDASAAEEIASRIRDEIEKLNLLVR